MTKIVQRLVTHLIRIRTNLLPLIVLKAQVMQQLTIRIGTCRLLLLPTYFGGHGQAQYFLHQTIAHSGS